MAAFSLCCPKCAAILNLATRPAEGKKVKCPKCSAVFVAADNEAPGKATAIKPASSRPVAAPVSKGRPTAADDDDDKALRRRKSRSDIDDEDDEEERPRRGKGKQSLDDADDDRPRRSGKKKQKSNTGLIIGLCAGVGVLFLACAGTAGGVIWWLNKSQPDAVAKGPEGKPIAPQAAKNPQVQPPNNANAAPPAPPGPAVKPPNNPANNKPRRPRRNPPVQPANPPPQPAPQPAPAQQPEPPPQPAAEPEPAKPPEPPPQPAPLPVAGPVDLDKALLAKTTRATVFIHVNVGKESATGSGFIVKSTGDTAYIITNYHVIDVEEKAAPKPGGPGMQWRFGRRIIPGPPRMGPRGRRPAPAPAKTERRVTVVFNSGTPEAQALPAEVVATDDESDLAALRVTGARNLPEALDLSQEAGVVEQQPVYIFGFPANKRPAGPGYPPVNVEKGTVAGLRRDAGNNLIDVHINGDLNPGNSGGPIIDANGRLVGIAVAAVLGKQIGFAIPATVLHQMFKGRLSRGVVIHIAQKGPQLNLSGEIWAYDHKSTVRGRKALSMPLSNVQRGSPPPPADEYLVLGVLADPMLKVKGAKAYFAMTEKVASPPEGQPWAKMVRAKPVDLKIEDQMAVGSFKLPRGIVPDRMFAFQFSYINADNKTIYTQPHLVRLTFPQNTLSVTLNISGIADEPTRRYIEDTAAKILPGKVRVVSWSKDTLVLEADPVPDPSVIAPKISFGEVTVQGRTFMVKAKKIDLPPPTDADVTSALADLKSRNKEQRIAAADKLSKVYAILPARRAEVAKALEPLAGDKDIWIARPALRALQIWAGPENVAAVIPAAGNNFTCGEAIKVLSRFQTAEVAEALAKVLPNGIARGPAAAALKKMGPIAEKAVIPFVNQGFWVGMEACNILKAIGTKECIPVLTQAVNDPKYPAKMAAQQALKSVQARAKRGAGG
ncbi:MAG TPA: trypsin-like peptidase domain-containing protein [Gemmataceae bacterium]|nr:trypsin-like peptidase domain-containing protein [Gemmataceae bacterium]